MRKATVVALGITLVLLAISCLPGCNGKPSPGVASPALTKTVVVPGHQWTMSMTEEQMDLLKNSWGREVTILELTNLLWPEVTRDIPQHMVDCWRDKKVIWFAPDLSNLVEGPIPSTGLLDLKNGTYHVEGYWMYEFYIGLVTCETPSMMIEDCLGVTSDKCYRVSLYTDNILDKERRR